MSANVAIYILSLAQGCRRLISYGRFVLLYDIDLAKCKENGYDSDLSIEVQVCTIKTRPSSISQCKYVFDNTSPNFTIVYKMLATILLGVVWPAPPESVQTFTDSMTTPETDSVCFIYLTYIKALETLHDLLVVVIPP